MGNLIQPIRRTTQTWVVMCYQYGISALISQTSFAGETSGSIAKCQLFSEANFVLDIPAFFLTFHVESRHAISPPSIILRYVVKLMTVHGFKACGM